MEIWKLFAWYDSLLSLQTHHDRNCHNGMNTIWMLFLQTSLLLIFIIHTEEDLWRLEIKWSGQLFNLWQTFFAPDSGFRTSRQQNSGHERFSSHKYFSVANIFFLSDRQLGHKWKLLRFSLSSLSLDWHFDSLLTLPHTRHGFGFILNECGGW